MTFALLALTLSLAADEPKPELLWPKGAPGAVGEEPADKPTLTAYLPPPDKATGAAVVVCPGGGYGNLAADHEGRQPAKWLNERGVAFIEPLGSPQPLDCLVVRLTLSGDAGDSGVPDAIFAAAFD